MEDPERQRLLELRAELQRAGKALRAELETVLASGDPPAVHAFATRLHEHHNRLAEYHAALESFHKRFGALGEG